MKFLAWCIKLSLFVVLSSQAETIALSPDDWYQNQYAPLWKENPAQNVEKAAGYYAEIVYLHPPEGPIEAVSSREWIAESVAGWISDGWLGSAVANLRSDRLNPTTTAFKAKWRDWYADGSEDFSCGWYLADLDGDRWLITQYGEIDCAEHNL